MGAVRREDKQISFRVSYAEYERLKMMAEAVGMSVPMFCKKKAKGSKMRFPSVDRETGLEIASELRRIGVNANQIAKHLNCGENVSRGQIDALQEELKGIWQLLNSALQNQPIN